MANTFKTQEKVKQSIEFMWSEQDVALDKVDWRSEEFKAADSTGEVINLRRGQEVTLSTPAMGVDYALPGVVTPPAGFSTLTDPYLPLSINKRYEVNLQLSVEDILTKVDKSAVMERVIKPALLKFRHAAEKDLLEAAELAAGQFVGTVSGSDATAWKENPYKAIGMIAERGIDIDGGIAIVNTKVPAILGPAQAAVFQAQAAARETYGTGVLGHYAGFDWYKSPMLSTRTITAASGTVTSVSHVYNGSASNGTPTTWVPTMSLVVPSGSAPAVGARLQFQNSGTTINFAQKDTKADTSNAFQVVVRSVDTTAGVTTIVVSEALVATGAYKNATADITGGSTTYSVINVGNSLKAGLLFDPKAIVAASPEVKLGADVESNAIRFNLGGLHCAIVTQTWIGTIQQVTKMIAFGGYAVPCPEGIVAAY